jgi:hypothetical protein
VNDCLDEVYEMPKIEVTDFIVRFLENSAVWVWYIGHITTYRYTHAELKRRLVVDDRLCVLYFFPYVF